MFCISPIILFIFSSSSTVFIVSVIGVLTNGYLMVIILRVGFMNGHIGKF